MTESDSEECYLFIRQVDSEKGIASKEVSSKETTDVLPLLKKSITAGEAFSKLNNILDVQARLQAFELPNDRPLRKVRRSEPISGSVRLAQLVSLERELKEAIYFRSLEPPWSAFGVRKKLGQDDDLSKLAEEFHKRLAKERPSNQILESNSTFTFGKTSRNRDDLKSKSRKSSLYNNTSRWPWAFQGKPGRKMWEPLPDTFLKPWEPWTKLREKSQPVRRNLKNRQNVKNTPQFHLPQVSTPIQKVSKKPWDPATHKQRMKLVSKLVPPTPTKPTIYKLTAKSTKFQSTTTIHKIPELPTPTILPKGSTYFPALPNNFKTIRVGKRSGFFKMPTLKAGEHPLSDTESVEKSSLQMATVFSRNKAPKQYFQTIDKSQLDFPLEQEAQVPMTYPEPWQFFKYPTFKNLWDPTIYKPSGSAWEGGSSIKLSNKEKDGVKLEPPLKMGRSYASIDLCSKIISNISTRLVRSSIFEETKSQVENYYENKQRELAQAYSMYPDEIPSFPIENTEPPRFPLSSQYSKSIQEKSQSQSGYYVDRGLEGALVEVQKAIKTAIPTFKLDKTHKELSEREIKTDEWMKKFIDQMTHTPRHKSRFIRLPLEVPQSNLKLIKPPIPTNSYKTPPLIQNTGDVLVVFIVNGKAKIPDFTVGTHFNTYLYPPKTIDFPEHVSQRITRCTICRPYGMDGRTDPVPKPRKFCKTIPLLGFRDFQIFFKFDVTNNKLMVNGLRQAKGDECYRNVTHDLIIPGGMNLADFEIYRSDKGTLFFHDAREELKIKLISADQAKYFNPSSFKLSNRKFEMSSKFRENYSKRYFGNEDD